MGGLKGERIFTAAYTVLNEFEEVRGHALTLTKSLGFVKDMFEGIQQGLQNSQNPPTQILYTDSPQCKTIPFSHFYCLIAFQLNDPFMNQSTAC